MAKRGNDKFRHQPHPDKKKFHKHSSNPHIAVKKTKNISKQEELFERYKEDLGHDYSLNDILEVGYPSKTTLRRAQRSACSLTVVT